MPINDPVKRGKVAPASLAFESRRQGGLYSGEIVGSQTGNVTYQTIINTGLRLTANINVRQAEGVTQSIMKAMSNAEHRAKHYSSDWHHAFEWDSKNASQAWSANGAGPGLANILNLPNEVLRSISAESVDNKWRFTATDENAGRWLISAMIAIRFSPNDKIGEARLAIHKNGNVYRYIHMMNSHMNDKTHIEEINLQGTCIVPLAAGDRIEIAIWLHDENGTGSGTASSPANYYAYVCGSRVLCDPEIENERITGAAFDNAV